jgi:phospholipid transport system substrate-binding protein
MTVTSRLLTPIATLLTLLAPPAIAAPKEQGPVKPIQTVVSAVRQSRDSLALKYFAGEPQGELLMAKTWAKASPAQKKEFVSLFHTLFAKMAFPKIRDNFKNLDTILYDKPKVSGSSAQVHSTILINHPLKKQELKAKYDVVNDGGWKVLDVTVLGDSMLKGIRDEQVQPLLKEGGIDGLLQAMRDKAKELEGGASK